MGAILHARRAGDFAGRAVRRSKQRRTSIYSLIAAQAKSAEFFASKGPSGHNVLNFQLANIRLGWAPPWTRIVPWHPRSDSSCESSFAFHSEMNVAVVTVAGFDVSIFVMEMLSDGAFGADVTECRSCSI